jgi:hypothetical protein
MKPILPAALALALGICPPSAGAQEIQAVRCRALCFERAGPVTELAAPGPDGKAGPLLPLPLNLISEPVTLGASGGLIRFTDPAAAAGAAAAAEARVGGLRSVLLVFVPAGDEAAHRYRVLAIDDRPASFPPGGAWVCNLTTVDARFAIGEHRPQLAPGGTSMLDRPAARDDFNMATVAFQLAGGNGWRTLGETRLRFTGGLRQLVVAHVDARTGRPRLRTFQDTAPAP